MWVLTFVVAAALHSVLGQWLLNVSDADLDLLAPWYKRYLAALNEDIEYGLRNGTTNGTLDRGLFPGMFNLAAGARVTSNATCGETRRTHYCRLVEHVKRYANDTQQCGVCDARAADPADRHGVRYAVDGTNYWWQSPPIAGGLRYHWVTITLDLRQVYQVAYVIVKAANSPRPGNWILERSVDGATYRPWQYYAMSDSECWSRYGVRPTIGIPRFTREDEVLCTAQYSKLNPLENGEIFTSLVNGRSKNGPTATLVEFTKARYVRLRFQKIRTLHADLMTFLYMRPEDIDPTVSNRYFYSIKDISIGGQCICLGHARRCVPHPTTGVLRCVCEDNTCGSDCEECCPMYHQKQWQAGTYTEGQVCEKCECFGHAVECVYNQTVADRHLSLDTHDQFQGGGVCIDCQHNTMGLNCEMCADGYFRPRGVARNATDGCRTCLCDVAGSIGLCVKDDALEHASIYAGDCVCREGYCGPRCGECSPGYDGYPHCRRCPCSIAGSYNMDVCVGDCLCKDLVSGAACDACLPGFYDLRTDNPVGCAACFCFGITSHCESSTLTAMQLQDLSGWLVTDLAGTGFSKPTINDAGHLLTTSEETAHLNRALYWTAPEAFLGNKLTSYGGLLSYSFNYEATLNCTDDGAYLANNDVIIEGSGMRLGTHGHYYFESRLHSAVVNLIETRWQHLEGSTSPAGTLVPREEFMMALARLERLLVRAAFNVYQLEAVLQCLSFDVGVETGGTQPMASVEVCACPEGYAGTSCEGCASGYRRVGNVLYGGICERCMCYDHAATCDAITGECQDCADHTQGMYCEVCAFGYFGNAVGGACQPCACPLVDPANNFARGCIVTPGPAAESVCIDCQPGYMGRFCEICEPGYYGNPMEPGSTCQRCRCHGNVAGGVCHPLTGACEHCQGHTEGAQCERCVEGYYGSAVNGSCYACQCDKYGSTGPSCDPITGHCTCAERYTGRACDWCEPGYGDTRRGCPACRCNATGSKSDLCDPGTGRCVCRRGVGGMQCDRCQQRHYLFSPTGCLQCLCHLQGSTDLDCDRITGQCNCKSNVTAHACDACLPDCWGLDSGRGCQPCRCDGVGSSTTSCDGLTGQCRCQPGVAGRACDRCQVGYYGLSPDGCLECQQCRALGYVCDVVTGHCVCPPHTQGDACERCRPNTWDYHPYDGCKCRVDSGQCECAAELTGRACDRCHAGHYAFPACRPCGCRLAGTDPARCQAGGARCDCDADSGQCQCKANVEGEKCDRCRPGSFGLQAENVDGCTNCFCFTRSSQCSQAVYSWTRVSLPDRSVRLRISEVDPIRPTSEGFLVIPAEGANVSISRSDVNKPIYWQMPAELTGDMTLSYNGRLTFEVATDAVAPPGGELGNPDVLMTGLSQLRLSYAGPAARSGRGMSILLREDMWRDDLGQPVSRSLLMVTLLSVQHVLVKAADRARITTASLVGVSVDVAVPSNGSTPTALGVEHCVCPPEYAGLSCQDPSEGYYRRVPNPGVAEIREPIEVIGEVVRCRCHGHGYTCDRDTGICSHCADHSAGAHCELCAAGYYGNATHGTSHDCQPCPCPTVEDGLTCHVVDGWDYACDSCADGFAGEKCDRCEYGYYGDPTTGCYPCECSVGGSRDLSCDVRTGQCVCYAGITGRTCNACKPRHAVLDGRCISCDEGCTALLMLELDANDVALYYFNMSVSTLMPWAYLDGVSERVASYRALLRRTSWSSDGVGPLPEMGDLADRSTEVMLWAEQMLWSNATLTRNSSIVLRNAKALLEVVNEFTQLILEGDRPSGAGGRPGGRDLLRKAEAILAQINATTFAQKSSDVADELRLAKESLARARALRRDRRAGNGTRFGGRWDAVVRRLEAFDRILEFVRNVTAAAVAINARSERLAGHIERQLMDPLNRMKAVTRVLGEARQLNEAAAESLRGLPHNYEVISDIIQLLPDKVRATREKSDRLHRSLEDVRQPVHEAERHARRLDRQSRRLEGLFVDARLAAEDPLRAANAYENMTAAIFRASEASDEATAAVRNASISIKSRAVRGASLRKQARQMLRRCLRDKRRADRLLAASTDFAPRLNASIKMADTLERSNDISVRNLHKVVYMLRNFTKDMGGRALDVTEHVTMVTVQTAATDGDTATILARVERTLRPKLRKLTAMNVRGLKKLRHSVSRASHTSDKLVNLTDVMVGRMQRMRALRSRMDDGLLRLRESILLAREQANNIKISLHCEKNDCSRRYRVDVAPAIANSISLHFKTNNTRDSMLLFLLNNPNQPDFLALELISRRVRLTWDTGAGSSVLEHPLKAVAAAGKTSEIQKWYRVDAKRIGNFGTLTVHRLSSSATPVEVTTSALASHIRLDVDEDSDLFVGGVTSGYKLPPAISSRLFSGCIGDVKMDGQRIGLYNFESLEGSSCRGCSTVPQRRAPSGIYQFDGTGYAEVSHMRYHPDKFSVHFKFKTFWREALLFQISNSDTGDAMTLALSRGRVVFRYTFGGLSSAVLETRHTYNTNSWVTVTASRLRQRGQLDLVSGNGSRESVEEYGADVHTGRMRLDDSKMYFGGIPSFLSENATSLLGCIRDVQVASRGSFFQDLTQGVYIGVQTGCSQREVARVVGLFGEGYVEVAAVDLEVASSITLSFRTQQSDALIVLAQSPDEQSFYSVSMSSGSVAVWLSAGGGAVRMSSDDIYNDALMHSILILKDKHLIELYIDDQFVTSGRLTSGESRVTGVATDTGGLYVGGLPPGVNPRNQVSASLTPLRGCVSDLVVDGRQLTFETSVRFAHADVGRCAPALFTASPRIPRVVQQRSTPLVPSFTVTVTLPTTRPTTHAPPTPAPTTPAMQAMQTCAEDVRFPMLRRAIAFGDTKHSHAEINIDKRKIRRDFNISLEFRTFHARGLLFYIANGVQTQSIAAYLKDGRIVLACDAQTDVVYFESEADLNNGEWHLLRVQKKRRSITISVDHRPFRMDQIPRKMDVISSVYVAGLPQGLAPSKGLVSDSLIGCMRGFELNGAPIDLANSKAIMGARQCFSVVEPGIHFDGWAHAIYAENYHIDSEFEASFDFRTVVEEGVIFSARDNRGQSALAVVIHERKLKFVVRTESASVVVASDSCEFCLCDARWHHVQVSLSVAGGVSLTLDGRVTTAGGDAASSPLSLGMRSPLYVGGYPDFAIPYVAIVTNEPFVGCLRSVQLAGLPVNWRSAHRLSDVYLSGCPRHN